MQISYARNFATMVLVALIAAILFCAWGASAMTMDMSMSSDCATQQSEMALCGISPQGHALWQNFLHVAPQKVLEIILAALLLAGGFFTSRSLSDTSPPILRYLRTKIIESLSIIDSIRHALSRGRIQPKIYELIIN